MKQTRLFFGMFLVSAAALSWACSSDDDATSTTPTPDAGTATDDAAVTTDAGVSACGNATGAPARALAVLGTFSPRAASSTKRGQLAAVNLTTNQVDGRYDYKGDFAVVVATGTEPYLLDETADTVTRLDTLEPWKPVATWDVHGDDAITGGSATANPVSIVTPSCTKAYVLRFNRNQIAVLDQSQAAGGKPTKYIDLSSLVQTTDTDGTVEPTAAVYVAAKHRVYVLLGNFDHALAATAACPTAPLTPSLIAIDVDTDAVVDLGGTAPGGGIALPGYSPISGAPMLYDAVGDRMLVLNGGCFSVSGSERQEVDEVSLATGTAKKLLDVPEFPSTFALLDANHAAIAYFADGTLWDPTQPVVGESLPGVTSVATDGRGGFVATRSTTVDADAGYDIVTFQGDGGAEAIVNSMPFTQIGDQVNGIAVWPHP